MKPSKYRAIPTTVDGIRFASKREAARYGELRLLERAGEISHLEVQPAFSFIIDGVKVGKYIADFRYLDLKRGRGTTVEDVKSAPTRTAVYRLKLRLMAALYPGVQIVEVK